MDKVIVCIGYSEYVMDFNDAHTVLRIIANAEKYEHKWNEGDERTHHIYEQDMKDQCVSMKLIPDSLYRIAKLAGVPKK